MHSYRCQYACLFTKSSITSQSTSQAKFRDLKWPGCSSSAQAYSATLTTGSPSRYPLLGLSTHTQPPMKTIIMNPNPSPAHQKVSKIHIDKKKYNQNADKQTPITKSNILATVSACAHFEGVNLAAFRVDNFISKILYCLHRTLELISRFLSG